MNYKYSNRGLVARLNVAIYKDIQYNIQFRNNCKHRKQVSCFVEATRQFWDWMRVEWGRVGRSHTNGQWSWNSPSAWDMWLYVCVSCNLIKKNFNDPGSNIKDFPTAVFKLTLCLCLSLFLCVLFLYIYIWIKVIICTLWFIVVISLYNVDNFKYDSIHRNKPNFKAKLKTKW